MIVTVQSGPWRSLWRRVAQRASPSALRCPSGSESQWIGHSASRDKHQEASVRSELVHNSLTVCVADSSNYEPLQTRRCVLYGKLPIHVEFIGLKQREQPRQYCRRGGQHRFKTTRLPLAREICVTQGSQQFWGALICAGTQCVMHTA